MSWCDKGRIVHEFQVVHIINIFYYSAAGDVAETNLSQYPDAEQESYVNFPFDPGATPGKSREPGEEQIRDRTKYNDDDYVGKVDIIHYKQKQGIILDND